MTSLTPLTLSELQSLAPTRLRSHRRGRYRGEDARVRLELFAPEDRVLLRQIDAALVELFRILKPPHERHADCRAELRAFAGTEEGRMLIGGAARLGHASVEREPSETLDQVVHDLRGGALQALSFQLQLSTLAPAAGESVRNLYFLARDHLKIMRNCVEDLDAARFDLDSLLRPHDAQLLVEKWSQADFHAAPRPVQVELTCLYQGTLCESCLEMSSLDRIIYNLMNNAARHAADGRVHFYILPVPEPEAENIRFVIANKITEEQRQILVQRFQDDPGEIFRGGFTTDGHGVGARICADFCSHAYGVFDFDQARKSGYFGARWVGDYFTAWFHWPTVEP